MRAVISALVLVCASTSLATAHISIGSGPAFANKTQKITFNIGHGCAGADTIGVRVDIPAGITSVRALPSDFGKPQVVKTGDAVSSVTWTKPDADLQDEDVGFYELTLRARVGEVPFTKILFTVTQTCRTPAGVETVVVWDQPPGAQSGEPGPLLTVVPARTPGWNKLVLTTGIAAADVPGYFGDALIVWRGAAAYSANAVTAAQITATTGVTALAGDLAAGDELWVRY
jgi:periplasmic copper chaperone A